MIRLYNVGTEEKEAEIRIAAPIQEAYRINMNEERRAKLESDRNLVKETLKPDEIVTIELVLR